MFETRIFKPKGDIFEALVEAEDDDTSTIHVFRSPFPVIVLGLNEEALGVGSVVGQVGQDEEEAELVIEIDDPVSPTGTVHLLHSECEFLLADAVYLATLISEADLAVMSAHAYAQRLDDRRAQLN